VSSINIVNLCGNLTRDPITRDLGNGRICVSLRLATNEKYKSNGEVKEYADFHNITIFSQGLAAIAQKYLRKGSKAQVFGKLETRRYEEDGVTKYSTEVVLRSYKHELHLHDNPEFEALKKSGLWAPAREDEIINEDDLNSGLFDTSGQRQDDEIPF